jgi:hypothetical protein
MHSWKKDLGALVVQTIAFARAITKELEPQIVDPDQEQAGTNCAARLYISAGRR